MSLTGFLKADSELRRIIDSAIIPEKIRMENPTIHPLKNKPNAALIGAALDYAVRVELKRRLPSAIERAWVAEDRKARSRVRNGNSIFKKAGEFIRNYRSSKKEPGSAELSRLAKWCLHLAEIDVAFRNPLMYEPIRIRPEDISDVHGLIQAVPWSRLVELCRGGKAILNPTFGRCSERVGGADADLILGNTLIDIKTVSRATIGITEKRQLAGYYMLSCGFGREGGNIPEVRSFGFLFPRQGCLWECRVDQLLDAEIIRRISPQFMRRTDQLRAEMKRVWTAFLAEAGDIKRRAHVGISGAEK